MCGVSHRGDSYAHFRPLQVSQWRVPVSLLQELDQVSDVVYELAQPRTGVLVEDLHPAVSSVMAQDPVVGPSFTLLSGDQAVSRRVSEYVRVAQAVDLVVRRLQRDESSSQQRGAQTDDHLELLYAGE